MSGLIIEGVCSTGKSTIFNKLIQCESYKKKKSKIQLSEHLTERVIENISPTVEQRVMLLDRYVEMFKSIHTTFYNSRFKKTELNEIKPCYLVERFHLTHSVETATFEPFMDIDRKLSELDFKVVALIMDKEIIKDRIEDTLNRRGKLWYNYVMSFGGLDGASEKYYRMQNELLYYIEKTSLPVKIINTSNMEWDLYSDSIEKFWNI